MAKGLENLLQSDLQELKEILNAQLKRFTDVKCQSSSKNKTLIPINAHL
jgi:hypothetical protein